MGAHVLGDVLADCRPTGRLPASTQGGREDAADPAMPPILLMPLGAVTTPRGSPLSGMPQRLLECQQRPSKECLHAVLSPQPGPCNRR